jgi:predicted RNase H-like HicB family nuclease
VAPGFFVAAARDLAAVVEEDFPPSIATPLRTLSTERGTLSSSVETLVLPCGSDAQCGNLKLAVDRPFSVPQLEPFMTATPYTAVIRRDGRWWIGWVEEVPGVNSQGETREELLSNLREALAEAIEMNREDARKAAGEQFEEVALQP